MREQPVLACCTALHPLMAANHDLAHQQTTHPQDLDVTHKTFPGNNLYIYNTNKDPVSGQPHTTHTNTQTHTKTKIQKKTIKTA